MLYENRKERRRERKEEINEHQIMALQREGLGESEWFTRHGNTPKCSQKHNKLIRYIDATMPILFYRDNCVGFTIN